MKVLRLSLVMIAIAAVHSVAAYGQGQTRNSAFTGVLGTCSNMVFEGNGDQVPDLFARCGEVVFNGDMDAALIVGRDELGAAGRHATEAAVSQAANVATRMAALRSGASGVSVASLGDDGGWMFPVEAVVADLARGNAQSEAKRWGFFLNGDTAFGDRDPGGEDVGFDFDSLGVTLGFDYRFSDRAFGGVALGLWEGDNDLEGGGGVAGNGQGSLEIEGESLTLYSTFGLGESFFVDGSLTLGRNDYDSTTVINYDINEVAVEIVDGLIVPTIQDTVTQVRQIAEGDTEGDLVSGSLAVGHDHARGSFRLQTVLRADYSKLDVDGYTESFSNPGAAGSQLRLQVLDQEIESLIADLGFTFSWAKSRKWGVFIPQLRAGWSHEFEDDARQVVTRLAEDPNLANRVSMPPPGNPLGLETTPIPKDLIVFTDEPDRDFFTAGAGITAVFKKGRQAFLVWDTILGRGDLTYNSLTAGFRLEF